jgi:hypothetical protein
MSLKLLKLDIVTQNEKREPYTVYINIDSISSISSDNE